MAVAGFHAGHRADREHHRTRQILHAAAAVPSVLALLAVVAGWVVGGVVGISYLREADSPMAMATGIYIGLAAVAVSIIVVILAVNHLATHYFRPRTRR